MSGQTTNDEDQLGPAAKDDEPILTSRWSWTGIGPYPNASAAAHKVRDRGKTLWDVLQLIIVPIILLGATGVLDRTNNRLNDERAQDMALQTYLDKIGDLMLNDSPLGQCSQTDVKCRAARSLAKARTLTVLSALDGVRKGRVLQFLNDSKLIGKSDYAVDLRYADLSKVNLSNATLLEVYLSLADLTDADLSGADLTGTLLQNANLTNANMTNAILTKVDLSGANLTGANLTGANLTDTIITEEQLKTVKSRAGIVTATSIPTTQP